MEFGVNLRRFALSAILRLGQGTTMKNNLIYGRRIADKK